VKKRLITSMVAGWLMAALMAGVAAADDNVDVLEHVPAVVTVTDPATTPDFPVASISRADCDVVVRVVADDGSAQEWMSCALTDEPVMIPENQGTAPMTPVVRAGGECIWTSDYWYTKDGSDIKAAAFQLTVLPSGQVFAWSSYPAEPLVCPEEE
jgi:hypothetical protein